MVWTHDLTLWAGLLVLVTLLALVSGRRPLRVAVRFRDTGFYNIALGFVWLAILRRLAAIYGFDIPAGYIYIAVAFALVIEALNYIRHYKIKRRLASDGNIRHHAIDAILRMLGAKEADVPEQVQVQDAAAVLQEASKVTSLLSPAERVMLQGVLNLSERPVHTIMTPRIEVEYINIRNDAEKNFEMLQAFVRSHILIVDGDMDNVLGVLRKDDLMRQCVATGDRTLSTKILHEPSFVQKRTPVMTLLELFKRVPVEMAVVIDEFGSLEGVVTHLDLLEAIAGEFPSRDAPEAPSIVEEEEGNFLIDGLASIYEVRTKLGVIYKPDGRFATIAGLLLHELGRVPAQGDTMEWHGYLLEVVEMDGRRIDKIKVTRLPEAAV